MTQLHRLIDLIERSGLQAPHLDYAFHPDREWRLTLAWPDQKVAIYYFRNVREIVLAKLDEAQILGWVVLLVDDVMVTSGRVVFYLNRAFKLKETIHATRKEEGRTSEESAAYEGEAY